MNKKQKAILRYMSGAKMHIQPDWGMNQLQKILAYNAIADGHRSDEGDNFCAEEKAKTQSTEIYFGNSYQGEYDSLDNIKAGSIAVVSMSGTMMVQDAMCSYGMNSMDTRMRTLYKDDRIAGIIMKVDSGGGYSTAGDILFNTLMDKNKPVVVHAIFMCSAALKGTLPANEIIALSESTTIGSIGTMMLIPKWYVESEKENNIELYSDGSPNKNGAWRALKNGETGPYIKELTENDEIFMNCVKKYRSLNGTPTMKKETLSGATFSAGGKTGAKARGLVDGIGSLNHAIKRLNSHIKSK